MDDSDLYSLLTAQDEPTAQQRAQSLAAALRGQQADAQSQQLLGSLSGRGPANGPGRAASFGSALATEGANNYADAQKTLEAIPSVGEHRLKMAIDKKKADAEAAFHNSMAGIAQQRATTGENNEKSQETYRQGMVAARQRIASAAATAGVTLTPEALDQAQQLYAMTGQMPNFGMGRQGGAVKVAIANAAAASSPGQNIAANKAGYKANSASLGKQTAQADLMDAAESTALKNLDTFTGMASKVFDAGSPMLNLPGRKFAQHVAGDPNMAAFEAARQTAVSEIGKVLSGSLGSGGLSDSARQEVQHLIGPDATVAQIVAASDILKKDMANRHAAVRGQIATTQGRIVPGHAAPAAGPTRMGFPDGSTHDVPAEKVEAARARGGKEISP